MTYQRPREISTSQRSRRSGLALVASILGFAAVPACISAQVDDIFNVPLEDLLNVRVEVASFFLEEELYVGSSVSRVTEEQWREQGAEKTFDALEHLPGVYVSEYLHGMMVPTFRGFANTGQYNSFLVLLDGMPLNNYSSASAVYGTPNFALGNLRHIEVIRGPGSALHGADAFNGVISLNTWTSEEDQFETWLEAGSFGFWQGNIRFKQSFAEGIHLTSAISVGGVHDEGIEHNFHESSLGPLREAKITKGYENLTTSHKLAIKNFNLGVYYSANDVLDADGNGELSLAFPFGSVLLLPNGHHTDGRAQMSALRLSHTAAWLNEWTLESRAYHVRDELVGRFGVTNVGRPPELPALKWDSKDQRTGFHLISKKPFHKSQVQLLFAVNYDSIKVDRFRVDVTGSLAPQRAASRELFGWTGQVERRFLDQRLQVILGARYDRYSDFGDHISPRLAVIYHPTRRSALKFLYGNAYRAPSINEQLDNGIIGGGGEALGPELVDTLEVVWKQINDMWSYSVSSYYSEVSDSISIGGGVDGFLLGYGNNLDAKSYGLEIEGVLKSGRWEFRGNLSLNRAKPTKLVESVENFWAYPDLIFNLGISYRPCDSFKIALNQMLHEGRETFYPGPAVTPSYRVEGPLPTLLRTDVHGSWRPRGTTSRMEFYATVLDLLDQQAILSSINIVEIGNGTPGRRFTLGVRTLF